MINILIIDDHYTTSIGTKMILSSEEDMKVSILTNSSEILNIISKTTYDIFLVDLFMPGLNGIELTKLISKNVPNAKIIIYSGFDLISHYNILIESGVSGFISKISSREQIISAIRCAMNDEAIIPINLLKQLRKVNSVVNIAHDIESLENITLSEREQKIMQCVANGLTNKKIAEELFLSQRTIEYNLKKIFDKLKVSSRAEALKVAYKFGIVNNQIDKIL